MRQSHPTASAWLASARRRRLFSTSLALIVVVGLALPIIGAAADPEVTLTGRVVIDHGDGQGRPSVQYTMLETASERFTLTNIGSRTLRRGMLVRVRGHRRGSAFELSSDRTALTVATGMTSGAALSADDAPSSGSPTAQTGSRRLAVLLVNFAGSTPTPSASASPSPSPSPSPSESTSPTGPPGSDEPSSEPPTDTPTEAAIDGENPTPMPSAEPSPEPPPSVEPSPSASPSPQPSPTNAPPEPWTLDSVRGLYFTNTRSVASYYGELSNGAMAMTGDVFGYFTIVASTSSCSYSAWGTAARTAATAAGIDLTQYTNVVHAFPTQDACWWDGMSTLPGRNTWINGAMTLYVAAHEIGHNLGVDHASSLICKSGTVRVSFSSNCTVDEYGDPYDVMGANGSRLMHNWHRYQLGFIGPAEVQTVTATGTYTLSPAHTSGSSPRVLRIQRPDGLFYYLEYRQPYGVFDNFSTTAPPVNGVTIRVAPDLTVVRSRLIDANPQTATFSDAPLQVDRTFLDPINTIYVTVVAIRAEDAVVSVQVGPDVTPPGAPPELSATTQADGAIHLAWSPAADETFVTGYEIWRGGALIATTSSTSFVDSGLMQAVSYSYSVLARDRSNAGPSSSIDIYLPDTIAPAAPSWLLARLETPTSVALEWSAAADNVGVVGYSIWRDGSEIATTTGTTYKDESAPGGAGNYEVHAVDAAGNWSSAVGAAVDTSDAVAPLLVGPLVLDTDSTAVTLSWAMGADAFGVAGYAIERNGAWVADVLLAGWIDTGVAPANTYEYTVVALDPSGNRSVPISNSIYVPDVTAPAAPGSLIANLNGDGTAAIRWAAASDDVGVDHYAVSVNGAQFAETAELEVGSVVEQGRTYRFEVRAVDAAGNMGGPAGAELIVPDVTAPQAVPSFSAMPSGSNSVALSWGSAQDNVGVVGYRLKRDGSLVASLAPDRTSYTNTGLASGRLYAYQIEVVDGAGNVSPSMSATATLVSPDLTPPSTPTGLRAKSMGARRVSLSWKPSVDNRPGTITYRVFRNGVRVAIVTSLSYVDRPAKVGTYKYKVRAVDAAGNLSTLSAPIYGRAVR